ncbi:PAS domain S-box protein [Pseudomonas stutzeri]|uniref:histidine kinase n=1 Tax=Stutzerimonas stutzeri TaxID=316 RepID=A0A2N8RXP6_STUST|nr:PAS domain-containing sensor histidine kinase [Stutzerimonas stutzeri]MCQ4297263.1 PAS domain S-box protein [Stutzerimonas stutzeri]PNF79133.1 PAS domain-containing protein [Stutzerimonas stutzeri]
MNAENSAPTATWNEAERLIALARFTALDTPRDADLDELASMAADLCACPAAAVHFIDDRYQHCTAALALDSQPVALDRSLCAWAIRQAGPVVVQLADRLAAPLEMPRLADGRPASFYAAAILRTDDGLPLGTLCVCDHQPRELTPRQYEHLQAMARQVMALLELQRLRAEEERSRQIIDSAKDYAILATDLQGQITSWNSGAQQVLGWSAAEALGQQIDCIFTDEDRAQQAPAQEMRTALRDGSAIDERWHQRKDGTQFWASGVLTPLDHHGQTQGFVKILRDLTESRLQQAATREMEEHYRTLVDLSPQVIWQCDAHGNLRFCNSYWCEFTGLDEQHSQGEGWLAAVATSDRPRIAEQWQAALQKKLPFKLELPLRDVDGSPRWFQASSAPLYDADGQLLRWVCVAQDIDSRRRSEMQRLESEAFTRLLLDSANEGFYSIDRNGAVTLCNDAFLNLLGFNSREEVLGRQLHQVIHHSHPDGTPYPAQECPIQHTAITGEPRHVEHELFFRVDGSSLPVEYRVAPIYRDGELHGAICTFSDISERTQHQALQAFLLELSDCLQTDTDQVDVCCVLDERLARLTHCDCIAWATVEDGALVVQQEWLAPGAPSRGGRHDLPGGGAGLVERLAQENVVPLDAYSPQSDSLCRSLASATLLMTELPGVESGAQSAALLYVRSEMLPWSVDDLGLVREVLERIRGAAQRTQANKALREAEQRISLANEIASIGVWEYRDSHHTLHWDTQLKAMAGIPPDQPGLGVHEILARVHPDDRSGLIRALGDTLAGNGDGEFQLDYRIFDTRISEFVWLANRGRRLLDPSGEVRILGTARNITAERNAAERMLRMNEMLEEQIKDRQQAEQRQTALIELGDLLREQHDSQTIAHAAVSVIGRTIGISRVLFASVDISSQSATIERYWSDGSSDSSSEVVHFADYGDFFYDLQENELVVIEDVLHDARTASHAENFAESQIRSIVCVPLFEQGRISAVLMLLEEQPRNWFDDDISFIREIADRAWSADERMRAERALRESEEQFRTLADNMSQFAWMADPAGRIYWYNKRWYDYTGTTGEAMRALGWRAVNHPDHHERVSASMKRAFAIGSIWEETFPLRGKDGKYRWFLSRALPIRDDFGQVTHWFGTNTDVTAQVAAEEALRELNDNLERRVAERTRELAAINSRLHIEMAERERAEDALRHAQKMEAIGQLTGGLAHDFNNMLTGVLGALDLIQRRVANGATGDLDRYIDAATTSANRAAALTHRLLAFARRQSLDPKPVDVNLLVVSMEDMLRRTMGEHIQLEVELQTDAWVAYTDGHQLENALLNLVINARDAMPDGGRLGVHTCNVRIQEHQPDAPEPGDYVALSVTDNGSGMSAQTIAKAFDPFFTTKPIGQGTGLGLSMVYGFAKQTGGHVRIDSTLGQGTRVILYLPRNQTENDVQGAPEQQTDVPSAQQGEIVLVVEDEAAVRMLVVEVLNELGYQVLEACDASSAQPYLHSEQRLDLLVTDFGLPGINGRQLVEGARQHRPELKVLFITGYVPDEEMRNDFLGPGMDILAKPFSIDILAARIRKLIDSTS